MQGFYPCLWSERPFRALQQGICNFRNLSEDLMRNGTLHEYYDPDTGAPIINPGFQDWNYLVLNMLAWIEGRTVVREF